MKQNTWKHKSEMATSTCCSSALFPVQVNSERCKISERTLKDCLELALRNLVETVCNQLENMKHEKNSNISFDGTQTLENGLVDNDSTELILSCKYLAHVVGNLYSCLQGYLNSYRSRKLGCKQSESQFYSNFERVSLELENLLEYLQRNYSVSHKNELYYVFSLKAIRIVNLYVLANLLHRSQVYHSFWNYLDAEIESCSKVGPVPILLTDVSSNTIDSENGVLYLSWHRILQECLENVGKFLSSQKGKEVIKDEVQTIALLVLRIATKTNSICTNSHTCWDWRTRSHICIDSLETKRSSSASEWMDSDDSSRNSETFRIQLRALMLFQQLASDFGHQLVPTWNIIFPCGTKGRQCDSITGLLISSPFPRIRLVSAKCISEVIACGKNFLSRMIVAPWKPTDRVALPRDIQFILLHIHRMLYFAISREQHSSVIPAIVRCVSIMFKVFPYHLLGTITHRELQNIHKEIFVLLNRLVTTLLEILKRERTDDTTYSAIVSCLGFILSIPFPYPLYDKKKNNMEMELGHLLTLITGDDGVLSTLVDMRNKNGFSGSLLADTYSALCQVSSCYFSTIFELLRQRPEWKQEMIECLSYPLKNEALQFLMIKFIHSLMKALFQDYDNQETFLKHDTGVSWEQLTDFWCCIAKQLFITDMSHLNPNATSLLLSFLAMIPQDIGKQPSFSLSLLQQMFSFIDKYRVQVNNATVVGAAILAFIRATQVAVQYSYIPTELMHMVEMVIDSLFKQNVECTFFSKATEALVELFRLVQNDQHSYLLEAVRTYLFRRGEELVCHILEMFHSKLMFRISIVRLLGSVITFHDGNGHCFLVEYPDMTDRVVELLCHILDCQTLPISRSLNETKLLWNACYMLSWIALHCPHDTKECHRRSETIFRYSFHRLEEEDVHNGSTKVLLACVRVLCCLSNEYHIQVDSRHRQFVEHLLYKLNSGLEEQWERKWSLLLDQLRQLERLWKEK